MEKLSEDHAMVAEAAAGFLAQNHPVAAFRALRDSGAPLGYDRAIVGQMAGMGWMGVVLPEDLGGVNFGHRAAGLIAGAMGRNLTAAPFLSTAVIGASVLKHAGGPVAESWGPKLAAGEALSTMCLTEPGAGSDLSRIRTTANRSGDDWSISGEKIFISGGDQDLSDDILHLVLARTGAAEDGVKGLSLFLTSKRKAGSAIAVTRIEEKMGLHGSPTCQLAFDACPAELIGEEGTGLTAMFVLMSVLPSPGPGLVTMRSFGGLSGAMNIRLVIASITAASNIVRNVPQRATSTPPSAAPRSVMKKPKILDTLAISDLVNPRSR